MRLRFAVHERWFVYLIERRLHPQPQLLHLPGRNHGHTMRTEDRLVQSAALYERWPLHKYNKQLCVSVLTELLGYSVRNQFELNI